MSGRPSFQSERSFQSGSFPPIAESSSSGRRHHAQQTVSQSSHPAAASSEDQQQQAAAAWPNSISTVMNSSAGTSSHLLRFSPSTLQNLNPLRPAAAAGSRNAASRGTPAASVQLSSLPPVNKSEFDDYLSDIKDEYALWVKQAANNNSPSGRPRLSSRSASLSSTWSSSRLQQDAAAAHSIRQQQMLPDLSIVPHLFMAEDFNLTLPRTFEQVTQLNPTPSSSTPTPEDGAGDSVNGSQPHRKPLQHTRGNSFSNMTLGDIATDQMLQEKLSHYLDVVEQHLALEIASRSSTFFSALSNLQALHAQSEAALARAAELKQQLGRIGSWSHAGLRALRMALRRHRVERLREAAAAVQDLLKAVREAGSLASAGEWEGALGLVEEVHAVYAPASQSSKAEDSAAAASRFMGELQLHRLRALHDLPNRLDGLKRQIASSLQNELLSVLTHQLQGHTEAYVQQAMTLGQDWKWEGSLVKEQASDAARPLVRGLVRCGPGLKAVEDAIAAWRESVLSAVDSVMSKHLPSAGSDDTTQVSSLSHSDFLQMSRAVYRELQGLLNVLQALTEILQALAEDALKSLSSAPTHTPAITVTSTTTLSEDLQDLVYASAELCNTRFSKALVARNDAHASNLSLPEFVVLFKESWAFVLSCEVMCKRMIVGLRGVLVGQSKAFLANFHRKSIERSSRVVEEEQWTPAEIPRQSQAVVDRIVEGAMADPKELIIGIGDPSSAELSRGHTAASGGEAAETSLSKTLNVEDHTYHAVGACLSCLDMLQDYLKIVINITLLTTDCMSRIVEFLKQFNSRTCQLVLGAGALRSAGLKNITAKHLALASQTISALIALIPYIRELLRRHLNPRQTVMLVDFDKLKRDLQDHLNEINDKLVSIMGDRLTIHCKTLQSIDWSSSEASASSTKPNAYMEQLVKEAMTLHKVLSRFMPGQALELVMMQVLSAITSRLAEEYSKLDLPDNDAKDRLAGDARYLRQKLGELKGLERTVPGAELEKLVQDLTTREQPEPQPKESQNPPAVSSPQVEEAPSPKFPSPSVTQDLPLPESSAPPVSPRMESPSTSNVRNRLGALFRTNSMRRSFSSESASSQPALSPTQTQPPSNVPVIQQPVPPASAQQPTSPPKSPSHSQRPSLDIPEADEDPLPLPVTTSEVDTSATATSPDPLPRAASTLSVPDIVEPGGSTEDLALIGNSHAERQNSAAAELSESQEQSHSRPEQTEEEVPASSLPDNAPEPQEVQSDQTDQEPSASQEVEDVSKESGTEASDVDKTEEGLSATQEDNTVSEQQEKQSEQQNPDTIFEEGADKRKKEEEKDAESGTSSD